MIRQDRSVLVPPPPQLVVLRHALATTWRLNVPALDGILKTSNSFLSGRPIIEAYFSVQLPHYTPDLTIHTNVADAWTAYLSALKFTRGVSPTIYVSPKGGPPYTVVLQPWPNAGMAEAASVANVTYDGMSLQDRVNPHLTDPTKRELIFDVRSHFTPQGPSTNITTIIAMLNRYAGLCPPFQVNADAFLPQLTDSVSTITTGNMTPSHALAFEQKTVQDLFAAFMNYSDSFRNVQITNINGVYMLYVTSTRSNLTTSVAIINHNPVPNRVDVVPGKASLRRDALRQLTANY